MLDLPINEGIILTCEIKKKLILGRLQLTAIKNNTSGTSSLFIHIQNERFIIKHQTGATTIILPQEYLLSQYQQKQETIDNFLTQDIRIDPSTRFTIEETRSIYHLLLLLSPIYQRYLNEVRAH